MQEAWETWVQSLDQKYPLEEEMATHSSILARKIPWTERGLAGYSPWDAKDLCVFGSIVKMKTVHVGSEPEPTY